MAAASRTATTQPTKTDQVALCGGLLRRSGKRCRKTAGWGTEHPGVGTCRLHGGCTPAANKAAARVTAMRLGAELQIEPHEALLLTVRMSAGWERYCRDQVERLSADTVVITMRRDKTEFTPVMAWVGDDLEDTGAVVAERTTEESNQAELHIWIREWQKALDQLARLAKWAIDAGVAERQVRLAEQLAGDIASAIRQALEGHGLTGRQIKPDVIRQALYAIEGGKAQAA